MDLFEIGNSPKLDKDQSLINTFIKNKMNLQILSTSDKNTSFESLLQVKYLFQKMLPKMPKDYILRQVFNEDHFSLTLNELINDTENIYRIVGAVCFRPCFERNLNEIVFFAIDSDFHVSGFGTFLFNCFKEICKAQYLLYLKKGSYYKSNNFIITDLSIFDKIEAIDFHKLEINYFLPQDEINTSDANIHNDISHGRSDLSSDCNSELIKDKDANSFRFEGLEGQNNNKKDANIVFECSSNNIFNSKQDNEKHIYLLTYADNSAIGFFKKQGFTLFPRSTSWMGYIKDYEGGTLMECKLHFDINYLKKKDYIIDMRNKIFEAMKNINDFHNLHGHDEKENFVYILDQFKQNTSFNKRTEFDFLKDFIHFLICTLQAHPSAWPFLEPVSIKDVPDYFEVIKHPMDLSLMYKKSKVDAYRNLKEFSNDLFLMCKNCMSYNGPDTQYYKCAVIIKDEYDKIINKYRSTIEKWGFGY